MNLGIELSPNLQLQQKLSFQMIQSLKLLQVNTLQLEQMLKTELELNPVLEAGEETETIRDEIAEQDDEKNDSVDTEQEIEVNEDNIDWEQYLEEGFELGEPTREESDPNEKHYEPTPVYQTSLDEYLVSQIAEKNLPQKKRLLVEFVIGCLESDGFLRLPIEQVAEGAGVSVIEVEEALRLIHTLEPPGVGARTLRECLMIQLERKGLHNCLAMKIIADAWESFEKLKVPELARIFGTTVGEIQKAVDLIKSLNPRPGIFIGSDNSSTIVPDLLVEKIDGKFVVMLNDRSIPSLHINRAYAAMIKRGSKVDKNVKRYIREKLNGATWLIRSIEQRKATMLKVMNAIVEKQIEFFEKGPPHLAPLKLQDIADKIKMHISTVSRVTNNKYVQTPHGIFELKYFFTEAMGQDESGSDISAEKIRNRIRELIETENPKKPLSDQKIADILASEQLNVARRTVAKYREQLKILPARLRQKYE